MANSIIKFADDMAVVGLITDSDETAYREEVRDLAVWCQDSNLHRNFSKTKELIVERRGGAHPHPDQQSGDERIKRFKFLCVPTTDILTWSSHTGTVVKKA